MDINDRIVPLDDLEDFEVAEGDPDVRGWDVIAADGRKIGEVEELLVDTTAMKVRYLDVDLEDELVGVTNEDRHVLIPIGYARLDVDDDQIFVDELVSADVRSLPPYMHGPLTHDYEQTVVRRFHPQHSSSEAELYELDLYDDRRFYGSRRNHPLT